MKHYQYIGSDPLLIGHWALGMQDLDQFKVQVDDLNHPMAHDWHVVNPNDWKEDEHIPDSED